MKELTRAEMQVMQILWNIERGFLKEILEQFSPPKPAPTTVATILRILVKKGFVGFEVFGKSHQYRIQIDKEAYAKASLKGFMGMFFNDSPKNLVSFFAENNHLSIEDLEEIQVLLNEKIKNHQT